MIRHTQLILADPERNDGHDRDGNAGDCLRAAVASILDIVDPTSVPNFADAGGDYRWWRMLREWARSLGLDVVSVAPEFPVRYEGNHIAYAIGSGPSPRGPWPHSVVVDIETGEIVWDPHPSRAGLNGPISSIDCIVSPYAPEPDEQIMQWREAGSRSSTHSSSRRTDNG